MADRGKTECPLDHTFGESPRKVATRSERGEVFHAFPSASRGFVRGCNSVAQLRCSCSCSLLRDHQTSSFEGKRNGQLAGYPSILTDPFSLTIQTTRGSSPCIPSNERAPDS